MSVSHHLDYSLILYVDSADLCSHEGLQAIEMVLNDHSFVYQGYLCKHLRRATKQACIDI